uniref:Uncharacterized protein n=1 Tax=Anguilla anguilla TaxID=7936 RepID=A0A0E9UGG1_ANGAN
MLLHSRMLLNRQLKHALINCSKTNELFR